MEVVRAVMAEDRRLSVRMIAEETGLDKSAVHRILTVYAKNLCKTGAEKLLCGAKSELVGNLSRFAGKTRN